MDIQDLIQFDKLGSVIEDMGKCRPFKSGTSKYYALLEFVVLGELFGQDDGCIVLKRT